MNLDDSASSLVGYLYHAVAYHGIAVHVAFLEFLYDYIFALLHHPPHASLHCGNSDRSPGRPPRWVLLPAHPEYGQQLFVNLIHTLATKGSSF